MTTYTPEAVHGRIEASPWRSLAEELEQRRREHRAGRVQRALASLRALSDAHGPDAPRPLRLCIADLERELSELERPAAPR
jgi:hypothetical protein